MWSVTSSIHFLFNVNIAGGQSEMIGIIKLKYITHILQLVFAAPDLDEEDCACPTPWTGQDYRLPDIISIRALWSTFYTRGLADADLVRFLAYFGR